MVIFHSYVSFPEGIAMWCNIRCNDRAESAWPIWRFQTLGGESPSQPTQGKKDTNSPHRSNEGWSSWDVGESRFHSLDLQNSPSKGQALQAPTGNWPWPMAKRLSIAASAWGTQGREGWLWYEFFLFQQAQSSSFQSFKALVWKSRLGFYCPKIDMWCPGVWRERR